MTTITNTPTSLSYPAGTAVRLEGLRCIWCHTDGASWLRADGVTVECRECGQTSLTIPDPDPADIGEGA